MNYANLLLLKSSLNVKECESKKETFFCGKKTNKNAKNCFYRGSSKVIKSMHWIILFINPFVQRYHLDDPQWKHEKKSI